MEIDAIQSVLSSHTKYPNLRCHIVHLSTALALPLIRQAKAEKAAITVETCFHYLFLTAEMIPDGRPDFKCCPPIRDNGNREQLWQALQDGTIDCVVSDHSPCVASLKHMDDGNIMDAWGGISSLGLGLRLLWTEGKHRGLTINQMARVLCENTATHAGLSHRKGQIAVGYDADFVIWDPEGRSEVSI
jgi:allantoinase